MADQLKSVSKTFLKCAHERQSLVRGWDGGRPFVLMQCDSCGAVGPAEGDHRSADPFVLAEADYLTLQRHSKRLDKEIARLEAFLRPNNLAVLLALEGAQLEGGG